MKYRQNPPIDSRGRMTPCAGAAGRWLAAIVFALCLIGCEPTPTFEFDQLDLAGGEGSLREFSLGKYEIPVPMPKDRTDDQAAWSNRLRLDFELFALVSHGELSHIADGWKRHEGKVRDRVIHICRSATIEELHEPELATLKARLIDAVQGQLGEVRRLLMTEITMREL